MSPVFCVVTELRIFVFLRDGDGVPDGLDNCVDLPNGEQADADDDDIGRKIMTIKSSHPGYSLACYLKPTLQLLKLKAF